MNANSTWIFFILSFAAHTAFSADYNAGSFEFDSCFSPPLPSSPLLSSPTSFDNESPFFAFNIPPAIDLSPTNALTPTDFFEFDAPPLIDLSLTAASGSPYTPVDKEPQVIAFARTSISSTAKRTHDQITPRIHTSSPKLDCRLLSEIRREPFRALFADLSVAPNTEDLDYTCPHCKNSGLLKIALLEKHIKTMHADKASISCPKCSRLFYTQQGGILHRCVIPQTPVFTAAYCAAYQPDQNLPHARKIDSLYHCPYCMRYTSQHLSRLNDHMDAAHYIAAGTACPHCRRTIYIQEYLDAHLSEHRTLDPQDNAKPSATLVETMQEFHAAIATLPHALQEGECYRCYRCKNKFQGLGRLNNHQRTHKNLDRVVCLFCKSNLYTQEHAYAHQCRCPEQSCNYTEKTLDALIRHTQRRHSELAIELGISSSEPEAPDQELIDLLPFPLSKDSAAFMLELSKLQEAGEPELDIVPLFAEED